jgi:hypothetical protein
VEILILLNDNCIFVLWVYDKTYANTVIRVVRRTYRGSFCQTTGLLSQIVKGKCHYPQWDPPP